jgi:hypothetical protein
MGDNEMSGGLLKVNCMRLIMPGRAFWQDSRSTARCRIRSKRESEEALKEHEMGQAYRDKRSGNPRQALMHGLTLWPEAMKFLRQSLRTQPIGLSIGAGSADDGGRFWSPEFQRLRVRDSWF